MGIYINGLKAPANCCKCRFSRWSNYGQLYMCDVCEKPVAELSSEYESTKPDWCPLIEIPEPRMESDVKQMEEPIVNIMFTYADISVLKHVQINFEVEGSEDE